MTLPKKYRKKPVEIEAMEVTRDTFYDVRNWCGGETWTTDTEIAINTLEGTMIANLGDYVIRGVQGEFYPCKPDIFAATYEQLDAEPNL